MLSYFVLIVINIIFLYLIGLYPLRELLSANYELGGIFFLFLSWILWIPSTFIVILVYKVLAKTAKFCLVSKKIIFTTTIVIQIISIFSVSPGMKILYRYKISVDKSKFIVANVADFEQIDSRSDGSYVYNYKLSIDNVTNQVQNIRYRILPMVEDPDKYTKYCPLVSATYNNLLNQKLMPGKSILSGEFILFKNTICDIYNPTNSRVKLEIDINAGNSDFFQYRDTTLSNWGQMYQDYVSKKSILK